MPCLARSITCFMVLMCVSSTTISSLQWTSGGLQINVQTEYPAYPAAKKLLVLGLGNCAVQMKDSWQRHFDEGDPAPTGSCDTWATNATADVEGVATYFGTESLQPFYSDYPRLTQTDQLYGFHQLPGRSDKVNQLYRLPQQNNQVDWLFSGDDGLTQPTASTFLPLYIQMRSSYAQLANCDRYGGDSALRVTSSGGRTSYTFGVYVLSIEQGSENQLITGCEQRQYTHSVGAGVSATWGGFSTSNGSATVAAIPLGVQAEYVLTLLVDPQEASAAFQDETLYAILEEQLVLLFMSYASPSWAIDVDMGTIFLSNRRASSLQVSFTVTFSMATSGTATSNVATMGAVLRQVVDAAFSTPATALTFVSSWKEAFINATGMAWPLPSVQVPDSALVMTSPPATLTAPPTPAPGQQTPTAAPAPGDETKEGLAIWLIVLIVILVLTVVAGMAYVTCLCLKLKSNTQGENRHSVASLSYMQLHQNKEPY